MKAYPDVDFYTKNPKSPDNSQKNYRKTQESYNTLKTKRILKSEI